MTQKDLQRQTISQHPAQILNDVLPAGGIRRSCLFVSPRTWNYGNLIDRVLGTGTTIYLFNILFAILNQWKAMKEVLRP